MKTVNFLRRRRGGQILPDERALLEQALGSPTRLAPRHMIARRGEPVNRSTLLIEGLVGRYIVDRNGDRQLVAFHVAGDFVDLHAFPLRHLDHDVETLTEVTVARIEHAALTAITAESPHLTRLLWFSTLLDAAMHREWIFRLGRLDGRGRVAHFICATAIRLTAVGLGDGRDFVLSLTQGDIADACGLTNVHVSRVLRSLREAQILDVQGVHVRILDASALERLAEFDPQYLYLDDHMPT